MINQTVIHNDSRIYLYLDEDIVDSGVAVKVYNTEEVLVIPSSTASYDTENTRFYYDIDRSVLDGIGTYTIWWEYVEDDFTKIDKTKLDVLNDRRVRYCYIEDVKRKIFDIILPEGFDLGEYTIRASNEIDRALQGLYLIPLIPDRTNIAFEQDVISLRELCSDIAAAYVIEDINVSRQGSILNSNFNMKKQVAFAELNRYVDQKKLLGSVPKDTDKSTIAYQNAKPRVSVPTYTDGQGNKYRDPFDSIYNNFDPRSSDVKNSTI